jgi:hypothetical protein
MLFYLFNFYAIISFMTTWIEHEMEAHPEATRLECAEYVAGEMFVAGGALTMVSAAGIAYAASYIAHDTEGATPNGAVTLLHSESTDITVSKGDLGAGLGGLLGLAIIPVGIGMIVKSRKNIKRERQLAATQE